MSQPHSQPPLDPAATQRAAGLTRRAAILQSRRRRGAAVVETALALGVALMFVLGLFDFGRVIMMQQLVENAAREGARQAIVGTSSMTTAQIQAVVTNYLGGQSLSNLNITVYEADPTTGANIGTWTSAGLTNCIAVQVTANCPTMTPTFSLLPSLVPLQATVVMYSEAY
jgi:Flp pilus assembly protein TadG